MKADARMVQQVCGGRPELAARLPLALEDLPQNPWRRYQPHGGPMLLCVSREPEVLISGPAGTGKSLACLQKVNHCCLTWPKTRALMVRKTRHSLTESGMWTFETQVLGDDHPMVRGAQRSHRSYYRYPNGSALIVGGLDRPGRMMSTEFDIIYVQEATELSQYDFEMVTTRARHGVMPFNQVIMDCNPDAPGHWLKRRCEAGVTKYVVSTHQDNPELWDRRKGEWTVKGREYVLGTLERLTGPRKQRLRHGLWVQAEGVIFEGWNPEVHAMSRRKFRDVVIERWVGGQDWGFTNPGVFLLIGVDGDGRMYVARQVYQSKRDIDWWVVQAQALEAKCGGLEAVLCDPAEPGSIAKYARGGVPAFKGDNHVADGINAIAARLRLADDGKPRLYVVDDSLETMDPALREAGLPTDLSQEFVSYVWAADPSGVNSKEKPLDAYNHALSALRYATLYVDESAAGWTM